MIKKAFIYFLMVMFTTNVAAQTKDSTSMNAIDTNYHLVHHISGNYSMMDVDALGNIYLLEQGLLKKFTPTGDSIGVYNDVRRYGNPSVIDVSNPLKTLIYFKNFTTLVILDRMLSHRATINLRKQQIFSAKSVAVSYDNEIWVLDEQDYKLKKISETGQVLLESNDLRLMTNHPVKANRIIDHGNFVYLYDADFGFSVLDRYGAFKNTIPFAGMQSISFTQMAVYGFDDKQIHRLDLNGKLIRSFSLPLYFKYASSIKVVNPNIYLLNESGVTVYKLPE